MESTHKEYVVTTSKDDIFVLSKKEYEYLLSHQDDRFITFPGVGTINPAFVVGIKEEPLEVLKERFQCTNCHGTKIKRVNEKPPFQFEDCKTCKGQGFIIPE